MRLCLIEAHDNYLYNDCISNKLLLTKTFLWSCACSVSGHSVAPPNFLFYSATKHAVRALTEGLKKELAAAKSRIRVAV